MESDHFDALARTLSRVGSRRQALVATLGGTLGMVLGATATEETEAKKKKPCPACKKRKKGKCKANKPDGTACPGGTCQGGSCAAPQSAPPPGPTCSDGIRNGSETDLDCGGTCPRCADFKSCGSRDDCRGALCQGDICRVCDPAVAGQCGQDAVGPCSCQLRSDGQRFCAQASFVLRSTCSVCPPGTHCVLTGGSSIRCFTICGAP